MRFFRNTVAIGLLALLLVTQGQATLDAQNSFTRHLAGLERTVYSFGINRAQPSTGLAQAELAETALDRVTPGVVSVYGISEIRTRNASEVAGGFSFLGRLGFLFPVAEEAPRAKLSAGTGFFISSDGYILTNNHVVSDDNASYTVRLSDGTNKKAQVAHRDAANDLALLKVEGNNYPAVPLGDSSKLKVGTQVLGLGNSFGRYSNAVSAGKVSALRKTIVAGGDGLEQKLTGVIQTTAQLYPGDSGGPLFDLQGNVVGINVAVAIDQPNVSFSIPINVAKNLLDSVAID